MRWRLRDRLKRVAKLAAKYSLLTQCWPGAPEPRSFDVAEDRKADDLVSLLAAYAPDDRDKTIDTSGDM